MLAIARGLMANPKILLLDEPSMGLAPLLVDQIFDIIQEINARGTTILLVEQNALMALAIAHRGYVLETGQDRAHRHRRRTSGQRHGAQGLPGHLDCFFPERSGAVATTAPFFIPGIQQ